MRNRISLVCRCVCHIRIIVVVVFPIPPLLLDGRLLLAVLQGSIGSSIVPGIVGAGISEVGIDCRTPPFDEIACPTLSESNILRHNTASS